MVYKTAYQKYHKPPSWGDYVLGDYVSKVNYRKDRRFCEHRHEPWLWESESEEEEIESIETAEHVPAGKVDSKTKVIKPKEGWKEKDTKSTEPQNKTYKVSRKCQTPDCYAEESTQTNEKDNGGESHDPRHDRAERKQRNSTGKSKAGHSRKAKSKDVPFYPYGWANRGSASRQTHNVKASAVSSEEVYPAALRAAKRRELQIQQRQIARKEASLNEKRAEALFNDGSSETFFPASVWMSEYQRSFCGNEGIKRGTRR